MRITFFLLAALLLSFGKLSGQDMNWISGKVVLKINAEVNPNSDPLLKEIIQDISGTISPAFPGRRPPEHKTDEHGNLLIDLTQYYYVEYDKELSPLKVSHLFGTVPGVIWAQPYYLPQLLNTPNDPLQGNQFYLSLIKAYQAWDLCIGDSNIVIGITDTGVENDHPDLIDNIYYNFNDLINGLDDDLDGYTDNFRGWDLGDNDNSPEWSEGGSGVNFHGVNVSGLASARTDNGIGISSAGYRTKFLPVKISDSTGILVKAYEGIVYAADHNCRIINCSWGGQTPHPFGQEMINYATFNKKALVIAAGGNTGNTANPVLYPAAYDNVICVAASNSSDEKWFKSCYGPHFDITSPGEGVYLTHKTGSYTYGWGTSFASPIAAGCAGIITAFHEDSLEGIQVGEILRLTCDNIDTITANVPFAGQMGKGRINLYRALTDSVPPSIRLESVTFSNDKDEFFLPGDTIRIRGRFRNLLTPTEFLHISLTTSHPGITLLNPDRNPGVLNTNDTISLQNDPFLFIIEEGIEYDQKILFEFNYTDTGYSDKQSVHTVVNPSYLDLDTGDIRVTITANGRIGYNSLSPLLGNGFLYSSFENMMYEGSFVMATGPTQTLCALQGRSDFKIAGGIEKDNSPTFGDEQITSTFSDSLAGTNMLGLIFEKRATAFSNPGASNVIFLRYRIYNPNLYTIPNVYAGLFFDWDIINGQRNKTDYKSDISLSYSWYAGSTNLYAGVCLIDRFQSHHHYAVDMTTDGSGGINIYDGMSNNEIYSMLSTERQSAGDNANGNDIADMTSYGPFAIPAQDSVEICFALVAGQNLYELEQGAWYAQQVYDSMYISVNEIVASPFQMSVFPNPSGTKNCFISIQSLMSGTARIVVNDISGREVLSPEPFSFREGQSIIPLTLNIEPGVYIIEMQSGDYKAKTSIIIREE